MSEVNVDVVQAKSAAVFCGMQYLFTQDQLNVQGMAAFYDLQLEFGNPDAAAKLAITHIDNLEKQLNEVKAKLLRAENALKFYAEPNNWVPRDSAMYADQITVIDTEPDNFGLSEDSTDFRGGKTARFALSMNNA